MAHAGAGLVAHAGAAGEAPTRSCRCTPLRAEWASHTAACRSCCRSGTRSPVWPGGTVPGVPGGFVGLGFGEA